MAFPTGWLCSAPLVVQHSQVAANLTAFPVLITEACFATNCPEILTTGDPHAAQSDGGDLRFSTDSAGASQIACEVVLWSQNATFASATAEIHVPRDILTGSDVTIYVWWSAGGGLTQPAANAAFGSQAVWGSSYLGVYHIQVATSPNPDSTANNRTMTNVNGSTVAGKINSGIVFAGNGKLFGSVTSFPTGTADRTISLWAFPTSLAAAQSGLFGYGPTTTNNFFAGYFTNTPGLYFTQAGSAYPFPASVVVNNWYHVAFVFRSSGSILEIYLNGASVGSQSIAIATLQGTQVAFGTDGVNAAAFLTGRMDEARALNVALSTAWILTEYNNQNSPGTFVIAGPRTGSSSQPTIFVLT